VGEAVPVAEHVTRSTRWEAIFAVSRSGKLVFQSGEQNQQSQLLWMDREGRELETVGKAADFREIKLSHDGRRVATTIADPKIQKTDIWIHDLERGTSTRLTFDPEDDFAATWSHDDRYVYFTSLRSGRGDVYRKLASGTGAEELVYASPENDLLRSVSADGKTAAIMTNNQRAKTDWDISILDLSSGKAEPFLATPYQELLPVLSSDGRYLSYTSNESGRGEVYVQSLGESAGKWQISTEGGNFGTWTKNDKEIIFIAGDGKLMAVDITLTPQFSASVPRPLFDPRRRALVGRQVSVTADGSRFLVNRSLENNDMSPMTLVQNWTAALKP
jgi:eukaryotic-like serine/threonine-protein kinase